MKKLICVGTGDLALHDAPVPQISAGEILVRMKACGICGTDIMKVYDASVPKPIALGHELVGIVEQSMTPRFAAGQRVAFAHHAPDPTSHFTRRGSETMDAAFKRSNVDPCGFAELIRVPVDLVGETVHAIPDAMVDERAIFMEPLACCIRAVDRADVQAGDTVVVVGFGAIGLLFAPLLQDLGASVIAVDTRAERLEVAGQWGAKSIHELKALSDGRGADAVILTIVNEATLELALKNVRDGGRIITFGVKPDTRLPIDLWQIYRRELSLISSYSATPSGLARAIKLLESDKFAFEKTISHRFKLEEAGRGFELLHQLRASKVIVTP